MLNGIIANHFNLISKAVSFGAKVFAIGMTGFGIKRLWSQEAKQKHSLSDRIIFASAYALHIGSTSIATATLCGVGPVSAPVAVAMVGTTSLLTNYVNLIQVYISRSISNKKLATLENELKKHHLDLTRSHALIQGVADHEIEIKKLEEEIEWLESLQKELGNVKKSRGKRKIEQLKTIYLTLQKKYEEKREQNEIIRDYFKSADIQHFNPEVALNEIRHKISQSQEVIEKIRTDQTIYTLPTTLSRLKRKLASEEQALKILGIINVQCIRYKKIKETLFQLELHLKQRQTHQENLIRVERKFFEERINYFNSTLKTLIRPQADAMDLEIGLIFTLDEKIAEDPKAFLSFLYNNVENKIQLLESEIAKQKKNSKEMLFCFNLFIQEPVTQVNSHFAHIRQVTHEIEELKSTLSVEQQDVRSNRTKVNFSTATSLLAISLCWIPTGDLASFMKPMMLGIGLLGSATSLKDFYQKNLFIDKRKAQTQSRIQCLNKELTFRTTAHVETDLARFHRNRNDSTKSIAEEKTDIQTLLPRKAKIQASKGITYIYTQQKRKPKATSDGKKSNHQEATIPALKHTRVPNTKRR